VVCLHGEKRSEGSEINYHGIGHRDLPGCVVPGCAHPLTGILSAGTAL
jgi:hypothetical protein